MINLIEREVLDDALHVEELDDKYSTRFQALTNRIRDGV
jgi:hypothetical protein